LMIAFAYGAAQLPNLAAAGWLHGLKLAAVGVVGQAVWGMGKKLCPDRARVSLCVAAACLLSCFSGSVVQVAVIVGGGAVGVWLYRGGQPSSALPVPRATVKAHRLAAAALLTFIVLLVGLPVLARATEARNLDLFDSFYRSGSLVFGGGHVVLPLLRAEVVPRGWLTDDQFIAGYGAVQALPGPMFTFSAYLGAAMGPGGANWLTGLWCLLAIFLPAWLLIGGALPFWDQLRTKQWAQGALSGANASVVGVLLAALYDPVFVESVHGAEDLAAAFIAFALLEQWKVQPLFVVVAMAVAGQLGVGA
jgi:chromate transporter